MNILHITTVHPRADVRIAIKELASLQATDKWSVGLVVADDLGSSTADDSGIRIEDVGRPGYGRIGRFVFGSFRVFRRVNKLRPQLVHFHDPELLPLGFLLKLLGYKVIYDVHEDMPRQIMSKHWLPDFLRPIIAYFVEVVESFASQIFDCLVVVTPKIAERFSDNTTVVVQNYPRLSEFENMKGDLYSERPHTFAYVGGITKERGISEMTRAIELVSEKMQCSMQIAGRFINQDLQNEVSSLVGWSHVEFKGWAERSEVAEILGRARAGMLILHPLENYIDSYPIKLFEYMACSLPVIASDFPLWRQILADSNCALFVEPQDPEAIASAMLWILEHPEESEAMGRRGCEAVETLFHWGTEEKKLIELYDDLLIDSASSR